MAASILVAFDRNRVIGNKGQIPWHLPEDMRLFKERTLGKTVIYGRKTWDSFHEVFVLRKLPVVMLPGRMNIVVTTKAHEMTEQYREQIGDLPLFFQTPEIARKAAKASLADDCFICGGQQVYQDFLAHDCVSKVIATEVHGEHEGDTFFPKLDPEHWMVGRTEPYQGFTLKFYVPRFEIENDAS